MTDRHPLRAGQHKAPQHRARHVYTGLFSLAILLSGFSSGVAYYFSCNSALAATATSDAVPKLKAQVKGLLNEGKADEAIAVVEKSKADKLLLPYVVPGYLAVLYNVTGKKPLIYSLPEAKVAVKAKPNDATLRTNLGILLQKNGDRSGAVEQYRKATTLDATDWRPHVGISQCLSVDGVDGRVIAEKELKLAVATTSNTTQKWAALGRTYLVLRMYKDASACLDKLLKLMPTDYSAKCLRLKAALLEGTAANFSGLVPDVITPALVDQELAVLLAGAPGELVAPEAKKNLLEICRTNFIGSHETYYKMGRALDLLSQFDLAEIAYNDALKSAPQNSCYKLSLIGNRLSAKDEAKANQYISTFCPALPGDDKPAKKYRDAFAGTLAFVPQIVKAAESPSEPQPALHVYRAVYHHINCGCRLPVVEYKLRNHPGIVFANLLDVKEPPLTVIYDARHVKPDTIISIDKRDDDVVEVLSDDPVKSLPEIVRIIQKAADKPDKHIFSIWSFDPPPMEFPE